MSHEALEKPNLKRIAIIFLVALAAIILRLSDINFWILNTDFLYINGEPIISTLDGYYYLSLAQQWMEGTFGGFDTLRVVPEYPEQGSLPPLLSYLTALLAGLLNISLTQSALYLSVMLPPLALIPLFFLARLYGGVISAVAACIFLACAEAYASRSSLGWYDTDILNLFFLLSVILLSAKFALEKTNRRYQYFVAQVVITGLWMWWWDTIPNIVFLISCGSMGLACLFYFRTVLFGKEMWGFILLCILSLGLAHIFYPNILLSALMSIPSQFSYLLVIDNSHFPIAQGVSEQEALGFTQLLSQTTGGWPGFILMLGGLGRIFYVWRKQALLLLPLIGLSALALIAQRYLIFFAAFSAITMGAGLEGLWKSFNKTKVDKRLRWAVPLLAVVVLYQLVGRQFATHGVPVFSAPVIIGMPEIEELTPPDAVVWSWWDQGYLINYWAQRATINDGSVHSGERNVYTGIPLLSNSNRLSANFMRFYITQGVPGINEYYEAYKNNYGDALEKLKAIMKAGPQESMGLISQVQNQGYLLNKSVDEWLEFFFPDQSRPLYLYLDQAMLAGFYSIVWHGSWSPETREGQSAFFIPIYDIEQLDQDNLKAYGGLNIDLQNATVNLSSDQLQFSPLISISSKITISQLPFSTLRIHENGNTSTMQNPERKNNTFDWNVNTGMGSFSQDLVTDSLINRFFINGEDGGEYFELVSGHSPLYQLWRVQGDSL